MIIICIGALLLFRKYRHNNPVGCSLESYLLLNWNFLLVYWFQWTLSGDGKIEISFRTGTRSHFYDYASFSLYWFAKLTVLISWMNLANITSLMYVTFSSTPLKKSTTIIMKKNQQKLKYHPKNSLHASRKS